MARIRSLHPDNWEGKSKRAVLPHLYLIQEGDDGPAKVGVARNAFWRRADLQCGNWRRLYLRAVYEVDERADAVMLEAQILARFAENRIGGEWLSASPREISEYIDELLGGAS